MMHSPCPHRRGVQNPLAATMTSTTTRNRTTGRPSVSARGVVAGTRSYCTSAANWHAEPAVYFFAKKHMHGATARRGAPLP